MVPVLFPRRAGRSGGQEPQAPKLVALGARFRGQEGKESFLSMMMNYWRGVRPNERPLSALPRPSPRDPRRSAIPTRSSHSTCGRTVGYGSEAAVLARRRRGRSTSISGPPETALRTTARAVGAAHLPHPGRGLGGRVHADLAWAKLRTLVEGARLASTSLWP